MGTCLHCQMLPPEHFKYAASEQFLARQTLPALAQAGRISLGDNGKITQMQCTRTEDRCCCLAGIPGSIRCRLPEHPALMTATVYPTVEYQQTQRREPLWNRYGEEWWLNPSPETVRWIWYHTVCRGQLTILPGEAWRLRSHCALVV